MDPLAKFMVNPKVFHPTRKPGEPVEAYNGSSYYNSGVFFGVVNGVPQLDRCSLTFDTPGAYSYVCAIHEYMKGAMIVDPPSALDLPSSEEVFAQASQELLPHLDVALWNQQLAIRGVSLMKNQGRTEAAFSLSTLESAPASPK